MTPADMTEEDPRLRKLAQELCSQLAINREQVRKLQLQIDEIKSRTEGSDGSLNRPNFRAPPFESGTDLERQNALLIFENQQLNEENSELLAIIKEYETTLQVMMNKFRVQAYEIQQSKFDMQRDYEALLEEERRAKSQVLVEHASLLSQISKVGSIVREAYDAQTNIDTDILVESLYIENQGLRQLLRIADGSELPPEKVDSPTTVKHMLNSDTPNDSTIENTTEES
ncbi:17517_t:CDS:2 [Acaulospora morrowiae]|uniref:17517_t:CDS:1 n=1 Tax=Acaulospora morrowiae TaxID=94023 RepID=A0A9N8YUP6_9GLOM|nr:17517_t:CDS:2 [Acaulospora morrowiae]